MVEDLQKFPYRLIVNCDYENVLKSKYWHLSMIRYRRVKMYCLWSWLQWSLINESNCEFWPEIDLQFGSSRSLRKQILLIPWTNTACYSIKHRSMTYPFHSLQSSLTFQEHFHGNPLIRIGQDFQELFHFAGFLHIYWIQSQIISIFQIIGTYYVVHDKPAHRHSLFWQSFVEGDPCTSVIPWFSQNRLDPQDFGDLELELPLAEYSETSQEKEPFDLWRNEAIKAHVYSI